MASLRRRDGQPSAGQRSGRIVYRDPPPQALLRQRRAVRASEHASGCRGGKLVGRARRRRAEQSASRPGSLPEAGNLYLCTGDTIPCKVKRIDKRGVWFESSQYQATFVPHEKIKAVELENASHDTKVNPTKRDRLLTLPRMRRDNPPTHLIRSVDGDYLRANVVSLDENTLTVEVRLEERHLPRSNIARIIWLHEGDTRA